MYFADSHMHSIVSRDSESPRADMARGAVAHGVSEICFTDHWASSRSEEMFTVAVMVLWPAIS